MSKKRKPAEPKMWMALYAITEKVTGRAFNVATISLYAHKTKVAGLNDLGSGLDKTYPKGKYERSIISIVGISWKYFAKAFEDFIDFGNDDDDSNSDQGEPIEPGPEDHGALEPVPVPALFEAFINEMPL